MSDEVVHLSPVDPDMFPTSFVDEGWVGGSFVLSSEDIMYQETKEQLDNLITLISEVQTESFRELCHEFRETKLKERETQIKEALTNQNRVEGSV